MGSPHLGKNEREEDHSGGNTLNRTNLLKKLHHLKRRYGLPLFVAATVVSVSWITMDHANALYILTGAEDSAIILDDASSQVREISSQLVYLSSGQEGYDLTLTSKQTVVVRPRPEARPSPSCSAVSTSPPAPWRWWPWTCPGIR